MAAPPEKTLANLTGNWIMNKELSDDPDGVLELQGIGWWTRRAIAWATVTLHVKEYVTEGGVTHIDINQTATGGIKGTTELRTLDWTEREHDDSMFGHIKGRSRWADLEVVDDPFLKEGWESENVGPNGEGWIHSVALNEKAGWEAVQIWGFAIIEGKRYHTRRIVVTKGEESRSVRLIYDFQA